MTCQRLIKKHPNTIQSGIICTFIPELWHQRLEKFPFFIACHISFQFISGQEGYDQSAYAAFSSSTSTYDPTTGYYYDSTTGLYYDPNTGVCLYLVLCVWVKVSELRHLCFEKQTFMSTEPRETDQILSNLKDFEIKNYKKAHCI